MMAENFAECGSYKCVCEEDAELGFVRVLRGLGRKRILISRGAESSPSNRGSNAPLKRQRCQKWFLDVDKSGLESLRQDVLIRMLCFVDQDDLRQLFMVSKNIREASLLANQWHFPYATPKKVPAFRNSLDLDSSGEFSDIEPPNAPWRLFRK